MTLPPFTIRCSKIGDIMTDPRIKSEALSQTCISYLEEWVKDHLYDSKREYSTKYTEKGLQVEDSAIDFASGVLGWGMAFKNEQERNNGTIQGTCDLVLSDRIVDIKSSWDQYTFPLLASEIPTKGYDWQLQGYMELWGKDRAELVYCLMDAPENIVEQEARRLSYQSGTGEVSEEIYQTVRNKLTFSQYPDWMRIKTFQLDRDQGKIDRIYQRVELCRQYIEQVILPAIPVELAA